MTFELVLRSEDPYTCSVASLLRNTERKSLSSTQSKKYVETGNVARNTLVWFKIEVTSLQDQESRPIYRPMCGF